MSQQQPKRDQEGQNAEPIKYGDVFPVVGELASKPVAPRDAATMQSAATANERAGLVGHLDASDVAKHQGVTVAETVFPGACIIIESVGGQAVRQTIQPNPVVQGEQESITQGGTTRMGGSGATGKVTIGEALEDVAVLAGDKAVEQSDAAAIQAAEVRATGIVPGGVASSAQSAASMNAQTTLDQDKIKLGDILTNATIKLPADKEARREDAEGVVSAELRNNPNVATRPGGVAASVVAAARLNEGNQC